MSYYYCPDARLCAPLFATASSATRTHTHTHALVFHLMRSSISACMCRCCSFFVTCAFRANQYSIVPGVCAHLSLSYWNAFTRGRIFGVWVLVSLCRKYTMASRTKNKSQARYESWTHKYNSANYVMERNQTFFSNSSNDSFFTHRFFTFFPTSLPLIVLIELICPHFFCRALGCRQTYHIDMCQRNCPAVQMIFFSFFFPICRCRCLAPVRYFPLFILQSSERDRSWEFTLDVKCSEGIFYCCAFCVARQKNKRRCRSMALPQTTIDPTQPIHRIQIYKCQWIQ